jgi:hypothetical protein
MLKKNIKFLLIFLLFCIVFSYIFIYGSTVLHCAFATFFHFDISHSRYDCLAGDQPVAMPLATCTQDSTDTE